MISQPDRQKACELIEKLANREITNDEFDDCYPRRSTDRALEPIFANIWFSYSDLHTHRLAGKYALNADARELFSRCAAFLRSDLEYEWPEYTWIDLKRILLRLLGQDHKIEQSFERFKAAGDFEFWPFLRRSDWELHKDTADSRG